MVENKICFVMPYHIKEQIGGGAEVQAWLLAKEFARRGLSVSYISQTLKNKQKRIDKIDGVIVRWVRYSHHFKWSNGLEYYRALKEVDPDAVIQRMTSFITGVIGIYVKRYKKKFVWICTDNASPFKWVFLKDQIKSNKRYHVNPIKAIVFLINAFIYDMFRNWGMKCVTYAFTQNDEQKLALKKAFSLDSFRMRSGHERQKLVTPPMKKLENRIVLWVANLGRIKQPEKFIQLARMAKETDFRFIMIGDKKEKTYIKNLLNNKPDNLEWLGRLSFEETLGWFDHATFFVNTSTQEGFPNTFIQSWLRGVPVFTLGVDPDNVIKKYRLGFVASSLDELLKKMIILFIHPEEYEKVSLKVLEYANHNHRIEKVADDFMEIIFKEKMIQ